MITKDDDKGDDIKSLSFRPFVPVWSRILILSFWVGGFYACGVFNLQSTIWAVGLVEGVSFHACVVCIALPANLAMVPTWGFYFVFVVFYVVFRKQICFGSEGVTRDKLVFGMLEHGHVSF